MQCEKGYRGMKARKTVIINTIYFAISLIKIPSSIVSFRFTQHEGFKLEV